MNESATRSDPSADPAASPWTSSLRRFVAHTGAMVVLLGGSTVASFAAAPVVTPTTSPAATAKIPPTPAPAPAPSRVDARWGAIAARPDGYGYAFDQPSRAAAEQVARAQCERPASQPVAAGGTGPKSVAGAPGSPPSVPPARPGTSGACEVRVWFERSCGALATGNFGEWGAAVGADKATATKAAVTQCDAHLPTEPCRAVVSVCSLP